MDRVSRSCVVNMWTWLQHPQGPDDPSAKICTSRPAHEREQGNEPVENATHALAKDALHGVVLSRAVAKMLLVAQAAKKTQASDWAADHQTDGRWSLLFASSTDHAAPQLRRTPCGKNNGTVA